MISRRRFLTLAGPSLGAGYCTAAPAAVPGVVLPVWAQLFGPVHLQAAMSYTLPSLWLFPGSALTASAKLWRFDLGMPSIAWAIWRMVWTTETTVQRARLVHMDDGPANVTPIIEIAGRGLGMHRADNQAVDITAALNALRGGPYKQIGFQLYGDGVSTFSLWESRLEIAFQL